MFQNVDDATNNLIKVLPKLDNNSWLIVPISESGKIVAEKLSKTFGVRHQKLFIESIFCQKNIDCEIAMVNEFEEVSYDEVLKEFFEIEKDILDESIKIMYNHKLLPKIKKCRDELFSISDKVSNILIVDETIETGLRMEMAIKTLKRFELTNISIAVPIISEQMFSFFKSRVDTIYHSEKIEFYTEIKDYYLDK